MAIIQRYISFRHKKKLYYLLKANEIVLKLELALIKRLKTTCDNGKI